MMSNNDRNRRYPLGIQTFSEIRDRDCLYVDKTGLIYKLTHEPSKYFFLSRPRRFGKSLLISTLASYYEGRKDLFKGLAIDALETQWQVRPVLRFDFSGGKYYEVSLLHNQLNSDLKQYEKEYGVADEGNDEGTRLLNLVQAAFKQTGQKVVILIDEYDAPLLSTMNDQEEQQKLRQVTRNFMSPLKRLDPCIEFVLITGITKFSQLSIFSELNNLNNISMQPKYAALCGITEDEVRDNFQTGIEDMAEAYQTDTMQMFSRIKQMYDGYHFCWPSPDIYNPFSLLYAFSTSKLDQWWYASGTPTFLLDLMKRDGMNMPDIDPLQTDAARFDQPAEKASDPVPVLYQGGYLTIKDYDREMDEYTLGIPNEEVRTGFGRSLMQYLAPDFNSGTDQFRREYRHFVLHGDVERWIDSMRVFLAAIPYDLHGSDERSYQALLYTMLCACGADVRAEVKTSQGRIDLLLVTDKMVVILELKLNKTAQEAISQIRNKKYDLPFQLDGKRLVKIGINISSDTRTISEYLIEE